MRLKKVKLRSSKILMYSEQSGNVENFNNFSNYYDIDEEFDIYNQKKNLIQKMNIIDSLKESNIHAELSVTQSVINLEKYRPKHVNYNYYNRKILDINKIDAKYFQGLGQISNQSTDEEVKDENSDSRRIRLDKESSKYYKKEDISGIINLANNPEKKGKEKKYLIKKEEKEKIFYLEKIPKEEKGQKNKKGRKKKNDNNKRKHNKSCGDNIIIKIKGYFFSYIRDITKNNFINKRIYFRKLPYKFISNLSKNNNVRLINMKMKDILSEIPITTKNKKSHKFENKFIIKKIYEEKEEKKIIQILDLSFKELFIIFRRKLNFVKDIEDLETISKKIEGLDLLDNNNYKDINYLIEQIKNKNVNLTEDSDIEMFEDDYKKYTQDLRYFCCIYEQWFNKKIPRTSNKIKNNCQK